MMRGLMDAPSRRPGQTFCRPELTRRHAATARERCVVRAFCVFSRCNFNPGMFTAACMVDLTVAASGSAVFHSCNVLSALLAVEAWRQAYPVLFALSLSAQSADLTRHKCYKSTLPSRYKSRGLSSSRDCALFYILGVRQSHWLPPSCTARTCCQQRTRAAVFEWVT